MPAAGAGGTLTITTTARSNVVGFGGLGAGFLAVLGALSAATLIVGRKRSRQPSRPSPPSFSSPPPPLPAPAAPANNPPRTPSTQHPDPYTYTVTATDGFLTHSATYTLNVTAQ